MEVMEGHSEDDLDVSDEDEEEEKQLGSLDEREMTFPNVNSEVSDLDVVASIAAAEMEQICASEKQVSSEEIDGGGSDSEASEEDEEEEEVGEEGKSEVEIEVDMNEIKVNSKADISDVEVSSSSSDEEDNANDINIDDMDEEDGGCTATAMLRTKNEIVVEDVEPVCLELTNEEELSLVGEVISVVVNENTIVIQSIHTESPLDEGSVLCTTDRKIIGKVSELFGPLSSPFYVVKCSPNSTRKSPDDSMKSEDNSEVNVQNMNLRRMDIEDIHPGIAVYVVVKHSSYVTPQSLSMIKNIKGSDASNRWDEEVGEDEKEFSDDEQEAAFKKSKRSLKRNVVGNGTQQNDFNSKKSSARRPQSYSTAGRGRYDSYHYNQHENGCGHMPHGGMMTQHHQQPIPPSSNNLGLNSSYGTLQVGPLSNVAPLPPPGRFIPPPQPFQWPDTTQYHNQTPVLGAQLHHVQRLQPSSGNYNPYPPMQPQLPPPNVYHHHQYTRQYAPRPPCSFTTHNHQMPHTSGGSRNNNSNSPHRR